MEVREVISGIILNLLNISDLYSSDERLHKQNDDILETDEATASTLALKLSGLTPLERAISMADDAMTAMQVLCNLIRKDKNSDSYIKGQTDITLKACMQESSVLCSSTDSTDYSKNLGDFDDSLYMQSRPQSSLSTIHTTLDVQSEGKFGHSSTTVSGTAAKGKDIISVVPDVVSSNLNHSYSIVQKSFGNLEQQERANKTAMLSAHTKAILQLIGEDLNRPDLVATPLRFANALVELTEGYTMDIKALINGAIFETTECDMVVVRGISFASLCEHHILPFFGTCHIGYIPNGRILGLSKFARITEMFSRRLQVQERLCNDIADAIVSELAPLGVIVVMEATHMCMMMRGVCKADSETITKSTRGICGNSSSLQEFFSLLGQSRRFEATNLVGHGVYSFKRIVQSVNAIYEVYSNCFYLFYYVVFLFQYEELATVISIIPFKIVNFSRCQFLLFRVKYICR